MNIPNILILSLEPYLGRLLHDVLELEGYTVVRHAAEAIQPIEDHADAFCILLADNIHANPHAQDALVLLARHPELRRRTRIIAVTVSNGVPALQQMFPALIDDYLIQPFTVDDLLACIETNAATLAE